MASDNDCPVCMSSFGPATRTEGSKVRFPCGHAVCHACDTRMQQRNFHSCPLCRTPREGYTQDDVDRASQVRALGDAEGGGQPPSFWLTIGTGDATSATQRHASWSVILLPNQATGDPFRVLRTVSSNVAHPLDHQNEDEDEEVSRLRDNVAALVGQEMQDFIRQQLLRPTRLPEFLEAHSLLRRW